MKNETCVSCGDYSTKEIIISNNGYCQACSIGLQAEEEFLSSIINNQDKSYENQSKNRITE
jgi:hypothetical protein